MRGRAELAVRRSSASAAAAALRDSLVRMTTDLTWLDAVGQAELVASGKASPRELVDAAIARIEKLDGRLNAVVTPLYEKARAEASGALPNGPFKGVPFLMKDLLAARAGDPIYNGNRVMKAMDLRSPITTYLAQRYVEAGLIVLGKSATPEFGLQPTTEAIAYGATHNPWDLSRSPGGSSGGAGAAVASGMVPIGHGGDGGGSIRIPASACGIVGLKPSRGRNSVGPLAGEAWNGLACEHALTRTVRDTAAVLDATQGYMPGDPYATPDPERPFAEEARRAPGKLRIAFMDRSPHGIAPVHADCREAVHDAAKLLESLGHTVEVRHPEALDDPGYARTLLVIIASQTEALVEILSGQLGRRLGSDDFELWTWALLEEGRRQTKLDFMAAIEWRNVLSRSFGALYASGYDLFLTPTLGQPPSPLGHFAPAPDAPMATWSKLLEFIPFTPAQNITGEPAISLPLYWNAAGLPIGVQLVAPWAREDLLIRIAAQLEQARPWRDRHPPLHA
jgi:amidase